ncbi:MAG: YjjG family noncanonical pyrimidine nucleotidase [Erysipelotrichaceae bacterium]|nr:YjjG family noncanonical pyrimidine nucleotidase [Erysipelotrichaceae bacterium]MDY6033992.1 YjjG family noncanonical pyrimidine nucleotidase [Bulleidia sp.]
MITTILWDIDGTILDFNQAERNALMKTYAQYGFGECTEEILQTYIRINASYWRKMEAGEITKKKLLVERFETFFKEMNLEGNAVAFNDSYLHALLDTVVCMPHAKWMIEQLSSSYKQYIVTNGVKDLQENKIAKANINAYFDGIFISEDIGYEKPQIEFFQTVFHHAKITNPDEVIIIGDSLTSDMTGGIRAGIHTCWYHPQGTINQTDVKPEFEIQSLLELNDVLKQLSEVSK